MQDVEACLAGCCRAESSWRGRKRDVVEVRECACEEDVGSDSGGASCLNVSVRSFWGLDMLIGIIIGSVDYDTERVTEHCKVYILCFKYGVRIPFIWWRIDCLSRTIIPTRLRIFKYCLDISVLVRSSPAVPVLSPSAAEGEQEAKRIASIIRIAVIAFILFRIIYDDILSISVKS